MKKATHVLLVEDDANDAELVIRALSVPGEPEFVTECIDQLEELESRLASSPPDLILADYKLRGFTAMEIIALVRQMAPRVPVVVVTGSVDEETAVRCMHEGASDYLLKTSLHRLRHAAEAAIDRARLRAENERQLSELVSAAERQIGQLALLGAVLESSADAIYSLDREGRYTSFNGAHASLMKNVYGSDVSTGRRLVDLIPDDSVRTDTESSIARALAGERFVENVMLGDDTTGRRDFEIWYYPVVDGTVVGIAVMARDVTERKRSEEVLLHAQKQESLGVLAGGVAHDFNNLLTVIIGNHSLALMEIDTGSKAAEHIANASRAAERAAGLTRQMLAYAGRGRFLNEKLDLSARIRTNAPLYEAMVGRNVRIDLELGRSLPLIVGDPEQIDQILLNLITNSAEAIGSARGSITIVTRREEGSEPPSDDPKQPRIEGTRVVLEVRDDGTGMSEETARRAFDPFFSTKFTGRGLGLAAVSGIVRAHNGHLDMRTAEGLGTRIRIVFPGEAAKEQPAEPRSETSTMAVLVIDDETDLLALAEAVLGRAGFEVLAETRGEDAIAVFRLRHDDIVAVVLDLSMPDIGGERVLPELRRIDNRVPVILSSGFDEEEGGRRIDGARVEAFLAKPYQPGVLLEVVTRVQRKRGAHDDT